MLTRTILVLGAMSLLAASAEAQQTVPASPPPSAVPPQAEKPICRTETQTGSRFSKRICRTKAEWSAIATQAAQDFEMNRRPRSNP